MNAAGPVSPWLEKLDEPPAPPLRGEIEADAAIVGGGFAGLSTAIALREQGLSVALLEREFSGFGASGRCAGHLTPTIGKDLPTLTLLFGRERSRRLAELAETSIRYAEDAIEKHGIDCAYEPVGNVVAAVHERQYKMLDRAVRVAEDFGLDVEMVEPDEMRSRGLPRAFKRAYLERRGGILHPGRYVRGLRRAAIASGAAIYEQTPVLRIEDGEPALLKTQEGSVRARNVVLTTNAYTTELGLLRSKVIRLYVYLFRTAPLTAEQLSAVGWRSHEGIYTAHEMLESYRFTDDNRIVGGAKSVRYGFGGRPLADDTATFAFLESIFRDRFPELPGLEIIDRWGGPIAFTLDFLPSVGRTGRRGNIYYAVSFAGHGVALASYAGTMIADLLFGREGPGQALTTRRQIPLPPEPIRWLVFRALTGFFAAVDGRVDRAVRLAPKNDPHQRREANRAGARQTSRRRFPTMNTVLITGASSGIGYAAARVLAERGWRVIGASRRPPKQENGAGAAFKWIEMDVRSDESVKRAVAEVLSDIPRLDALVNNAGYGIFGSVEEVDLDAAREQFEANFFGALRVTREVLPHMRKNRGGRILMVGSLSGRAPIPFQMHYSASKSALEALAKALRMEVEPFGVKVSLIEPGDIRTPFNENTQWLRTDASPYGERIRSCEGVIRSVLEEAPEPDVIVRAICRALDAKNPRVRYAAGPESIAVGLGSRLLPERLALYLIRRHFEI